jgi:hypothetical protein
LVACPSLTTLTNQPSSHCHGQCRSASGVGAGSGRLGRSGSLTFGTTRGRIPWSWVGTVPEGEAAEAKDPGLPVWRPGGQSANNMWAVGLGTF